VDLGPSAQNFVETGQGAVTKNSGTYGTYTLQQGSCSAAAGTTTCTLSGAITTGGSPGFTSGSYSFVTTFATSDVSPIQAITSTTDPGSGANFFNYSVLAPDVSMVLDLTTSSGTYVEPLVTGGNFDAGAGFNFSFTSDMCSGTPVSSCSPALVGLTSGAILSSPVTIRAAFNAATTTPEPRFLASAGLMVLLSGAVWLRRKQTA
jgi:hypothetical protein